jgi:hypothetical protein
MLNEGKVNQKDWGGALTKIFSNAFTTVGGITTTGGAGIGGENRSQGIFSPMLGGSYNKRQKNYGYGYGGRVQRFAAGGETSYLGTNVYRYNDPLYPTAGEEVFSSNLSARALIDPNNPQNRIRQDREMALYDYLNYVEGVRLDNERALQENIALNKKIQDEYNQQKSAKSRGAWMSFGFGLLGAGASQFSSMGGFGGIGGSASKYGASAALGGGSAARQNYANSSPLRYSTPTPRANGGYIKGFANGGSSGKDDIPALLMGGEFVMRKEAVNMYGKKFFDDLNSGRARKFAEGGSVGGDNSGSSANYSPTNNVNITVNLTQEKVVSEKKDETTSTNEDRRAENERTKQLAAKVKDQVLQVITEQQRPGGLLGSNMYSKRS